ncbi:FMN-binding negative transcriptional regulator [Streptomyces sp. ID05-26A]|nr:FMN-binding negative transcriptional regulator [Streptomyces sp. ID05-26A]
MFVPRIHRAPDERWTAELIRSNPLALLVTADPRTSRVHATHLPLIPDPAAVDAEEEVLLGHLNRANPHWAVIDAAEALAVFTGPHAYVSPTVYETSPAAPTWNFTAVHVGGSVERLDQGDDTLAVVTSTVDVFEERFGTGWDKSGSVGYFRKILPAVGAFRLRVRRTEAMCKLSQEQPPEIRDRVQRAFAAQDAGLRPEVARMMCRGQETR